VIQQASHVRVVPPPEIVIVAAALSVPEARHLAGLLNDALAERPPSLSPWSGQVNASDTC
jgi:hypothetical protein